MHIFRLLLSSSLLALVIHNQLAWSETRSSVSAETGADSDNGKNHYISARHQFDNHLQISAGTGKSTSLDASGNSQTADSYIFGIKTDPVALVSLGLDKSHAQQSDNLSIDSLILTLEINTLNWNILISPESRDISLANNINTSSYNFTSNGYLAGLSYYGWDPVYISWFRSSYDYPETINTLNTRPNLYSYIFGANTYDQMFALESERNTLELGLLFTRTSLSLSHSEGRSAIDQSISTVDKALLMYKLNQAWSVKVGVGRSSVDTSSDTTTFSSLGLTYKW